MNNGNNYFDNHNIEALQKICNHLGFINLKKVKRNEFNNFENIFKKTEIINNLESYDLEIPEDINHFEILKYIDLIHSKFDLKDKKYSDELILSTKYYIKSILQQNTDKNHFDELIKKYDINPDFIDEVNNFKVKINSSIKNDIKNIKEKRTENKNLSLGKNKDDLKNITELSNNELHKNFLLSIFRYGVDILQNSSQTFTIEKQNNLIQNCINNGYEQNIENGNIYYTKDEFQVIIKTLLLDKNIDLLRNKINIDDFKSKLENTKDKIELEKIQFEATNKIIKCIGEIPYILNEQKLGFSISEIIKTNEIFCIGYCLLGHAFLKELNIKHYGIAQEEHISLGVEIGENNYYFDATNYEEIYKFKFGKIENGIQKRIILENNKDYIVGSQFEVEKILLGGILDWIQDLEGENIDDKIYFLKQAINLNSKDGELHYKLALNLYKKHGIEKIDEIKILINKSINLNVDNAGLYHFMGKIFFEIGGDENIKKSIEFYEEAIYFDDAEIVYLIELSDIYIKNGGKNNLLNALKYLKIALQIDNIDFEVLYNLGIVYENLGGKKEISMSKKYFKKCLNINENELNEQEMEKQNLLKQKTDL